MSAALVIDALAVARLTRLVTTDTFPPVRWARDRILDRYPAPGTPVPDDVGPRPAPGTDGRGSVATLPRGGNGPVHLDYDDEGKQRWVWTDGTPLGELVTCPWCAAPYISLGVALLRWKVPRLWDPIARILAMSMTASIVVSQTSS